MKAMNWVVCAAAAAAAVAAAMPAAAQEGSWVARFRAVRINTADKSDAVTVAGVGSLPSDAIHVSKKTIPEVDFSYYFTNNLAAELILTVPQKHDVIVPALGGKIGDFKQLPPTLTAQWHFLPGQVFDPYVGAGLNLTLVSSVNLPAGLGLKSTNYGLALQLGGSDPDELAACARMGEQRGDDESDRNGGAGRSRRPQI